MRKIAFAILMVLIAVSVMGATSVENSHGFIVDSDGRTLQLSCPDHYEIKFLYHGDEKLPYAVRGKVKNESAEYGQNGEQNIAVDVEHKALSIRSNDEQLVWTTIAECYIGPNARPDHNMVCDVTKWKVAHNVDAKTHSVHVKDFDAKPFRRAVDGFCQLASVKESVFKPFCEALAKPQSEPGRK